jgi:hypothetical protein
VSPRDPDDLQDWQPELPPLDGDDDEPAGEPGDDALGADDADASSDDSLDDAESGDLVGDAFEHVEEDASFGEEDDLASSDDFDDEDIDDVSLHGWAADADAPGISDDDIGVDDDLAAPDTIDDGGAEGTTEPVEASLDERLPELVADDDPDETGDESESAFGDVALVDVEQLPGWSSATWTRVGPVDGVVAAPLTAVVPTPAGLLAAGEAIHRVDVVAMRSAPVASPACGQIASLVVDPHDAGWMAIATPEAGLGVRAAAAGAFVGRGAWRERAGATGQPETIRVVLTSRPATGRLLWALTSGGALLRSADDGASWDGPLGEGHARAIAARADGTIVAIDTDARGPRLVTSSNGERWFARRLAGVAALVAAGPEPQLFLDGSAVAIVGEAGVVVSRDGGESFHAAAGCAGATAAAFVGDGSHAPLVVALRRAADDRAPLVLVEENACERIAEVELGTGAHADETGGVRALAWDATSGLLWAAGSFGLVALRAPRS